MWTRLLLVAIVALLSLPTLAAAPKHLGELSDDEIDALATRDLRMLKMYSGATRRLEKELGSRKSLFDRKSDEPLTPDERETILELFGVLLEYEVALNGMQRAHASYWFRNPVTDRARHARHFAIHFAAYLRMAQLGVSFIDRTINKPQFEVLLDEGSKKHGIPPRAYERLKWNVVHVVDVSRLVAAHQYHKVLKGTSFKALRKDRDAQWAIAKIDVAWPRFKKRMVRKGTKLFASNGFDILRDKGLDAWFPVQTGVAEWMGDTKVMRKGASLISQPQIASAVTKSEPGDVVVERRNWYLSNVGLPGFWPHAALFLGSPAKLAAYFDSDPKVTAHFGVPFSVYLQAYHPKVWAKYISVDEEHHTHRVLEAMSEGVVFTSAEHSFAADYVAALRPNLSKLEKAIALERAFGYAFRPYDFNFDFYSDESLVCSELVVKAYEPRDGVKGLFFPLERMVGRMTLSPNTMIRQWDEARDKQMSFVWFLDGREKTKSAVWGSAKDLRTSWERPKWDIAQK